MADRYTLVYKSLIIILHNVVGKVGRYNTYMNERRF